MLVNHFYKHLKGRCDRTAIIARSPCRVEEAISIEVVSGKEAQRTLWGLTDVADIERAPSFLCLAPCEVCFTQ